MKGRFGLAAGVVATLSVLGTVSAGAATILDQAPNRVSGMFSDESFDIFLDLHGYAQSAAENFQVATGGAGFLLEEVVIWGGFQPFAGSTLPLWDDVDVLVHSDDNGLPGTVLCSESGVGAVRQATGFLINTADEYLVTLTLGSPCGLSDGNYWIEIYYNTGIGFDDWFWEFGDLDPIAGLPYMAAAHQNPGVWWDLADASSLFEAAVQLNGTVGRVACVSSAAELQAALTAAQDNGGDDVIQVTQGDYVTPGSPFSYNTPESFELQLLGGFGPGCTDRELRPDHTTLDGGGSTSVLVLQGDPGTNGGIRVEGLTITNGFVASGNATAGLSVGGSSGFGGVVFVENNAILGNEADLGAGGIRAETPNGLLKVSNNLLAGNASTGGSGAGYVECSGETLWLVNNTVADNNSSSGFGGLEVDGGVSAQVTNNILWGNDGFDVVVLGSEDPVLRYNDIGSVSGSAAPGSTGNISQDPQFAGGGDYRLSVFSPAANSGDNNPAGGLPAYDLDGRDRAKDGHVDMGAYEGPPVFVSSFEDPLLGDWDVVVGGVVFDEQ